MIPQDLLDKAIAKGTTEQYEAYVRTFPSVLTNNFKEWIDGEGVSVFAHYRDVSRGAGTGIKPPYSGLPLTQEQHSNQHQHGYDYYNPRQWWETQCNIMLCKWINNVKPPVLPEKRTSEVFTITGANHINAIKEMLDGYFKNPNAKPIKITVETDTRQRSTQQVRAQWGVVYNNLVEFYTENISAYGRDAARSIIDYAPSAEEIHAMHKRLHNDNQSTARLNPSKHSDYFQAMADYMQEHYKYELQMPVSNRDYY